MFLCNFLSYPKCMRVKNLWYQHQSLPTDISAKIMTGINSVACTNPDAAENTHIHKSFIATLTSCLCQLQIEITIKLINLLSLVDLKCLG